MSEYEIANSLLKGGVIGASIGLSIILAGSLLRFIMFYSKEGDKEQAERLRVSELGFEERKTFIDALKEQIPIQFQTVEALRFLTSEIKLVGEEQRNFYKVWTDSRELANEAQLTVLSDIRTGVIESPDKIRERVQPVIETAVNNALQQVLGEVRPLNQRLDTMPDSIRLIVSEESDRICKSLQQWLVDNKEIFTNGDSSTN